LASATLAGGDVILCQITSQARFDAYSVPLEAADFSSGGLNQDSKIRPNRLFTADEGIILYRAGHVSTAKLNEVVNRLIGISGSALTRWNFVRVAKVREFRADPLNVAASFKAHSISVVPITISSMRVAPL
jgi:mRNA interferase MazF